MLPVKQRSICLMTVDQFKLNATQTIAWAIAKPPVGCTPVVVYIGRDDSGVGAIQVALANFTAPPSRETLRILHSARKGKSNVQLIVGAVLGELIWLFGPDEKAEVIEAFPLNQGLRQLQSALNEPNALAAYTRLGQFRRSIDTTSLPGFTNNGLFASYHIRENVPKRGDWTAQCERAKAWLSLRDENLIKALGYATQRMAGNALILTSGTPVGRAVAVLLDESEQFESASQRHSLLSPVAWGLNVATRQGVPWLILLRKDQIRLYPARDGVGVGQKGQVETYFEIDLAAIDVERSGLLALIFSAEALADQGSISELLEGSHNFASQLGLRLRERIYEYVVPELAKSVAERLREQGVILDGDGLALAYRLTLRILFRLLFQAYAEDRGLLPAGRNESYDANSLKSIARRFRDTPTEDFGDAQSLWFVLMQVWNAIDSGNKTWDVPAYNGGLFGTDPELHPEGALIAKLDVHDSVLGPVLQHLLIDDTEDGVRGPVDFRSLSVREFGTIYEGLLESSLSVATQNLTVDAKGSWVPANNTEGVLASTGDVYFHSASGERKATGSYFTPAIVVDHLIDRALAPALDAHLGRIKKHLDGGDEAAAARDFFDFRVADLAMGSGHFLIAAVDRIEAKMRTFLSDKETQVPGITAELHRLANSAKVALGNDEAAIAEIEASALLRRQIARRCIYGLDINPLAVELSRLALWIHTFVPGLPMSSLDHGLVCANSLTGIGTIEEARKALSSDISDVPLKKGHGAPVSFYEAVIYENLEKAKLLLLDVANSDEANKSEVKASAMILKKAKEAAEPSRAIFDAAVAARLNIFDARTVFDENTLIKIGTSKKVVQTLSGLNPAHMPFLFPEVFIRDNPGFDVLLGNPPWEILHIEENVWWGMHLPGYRSLSKKEQIIALNEFRSYRPELEAKYESDIETIDKARKAIQAGPFPGLGSGHIDLYQAFAWRNWHLLRNEGNIGLVLPRVALSGSGLQEWRRTILEKGTFNDVVTCINTGGWIFPNVHGQYSIGLVVFGRIKNKVIEFSGPFVSAQDLIIRRDVKVSVTEKEFQTWSGTAAFPLIPDLTSYSVFGQMRKSPAFGSTRTDWEYRPVQGDLNATTAKEFFDFDLEKTKNSTPVLSGSSINLWDPNFGSAYAMAKDTVVRKHLLKKFQSTSSKKSSAYFGMQWRDTKYLPIDEARIAFRNVTNQTNTRTAIVCLIPPGSIATHGVPVLVKRKGTKKTEAFLLGVLSSLIFDWYARRWVELNFTFELLNPMPIPQLDLKSKLSKRVILISGTLAAVDERYADWANEVGVKVGSIKSESEKSELIAELDAIVALLYGLDREQLIHIFRTFHRGWNFQSRLAATLEHYDNWLVNYA